MVKNDGYNRENVSHTRHPGRGNTLRQREDAKDSAWCNNPDYTPPRNTPHCETFETFETFETSSPPLPFHAALAAQH